MTTFTRQPDGDEPAIFVNPAHRIAKIEDNIYGGFTEHMGRCIYGGLYDPGSPLSDRHGFRKDVMDAFRELRCPVVRYPGGNFVATYHWQDGIGPREKRPKRLELAWNGIESNEFGTDEFMKWCEIVGTEPYIALNFGTGTLDEALGWLEYCNSSADSHYANLRRQNGRAEPYNVKYWALGNECYGPWQVEQLTQEAYARKAWQWAKALKRVDPTIKLVLCGENGVSAWDQHVALACISPASTVLGGAATLVDMVSIHMYTAAAGAHAQNATAPRAAERAIQVTGALIDLARAANGVPAAVPRQRVCVDEWNVWDPARAPGDAGAEERYTLSDALAVAVWLNALVRQARHVAMANIAQSVNVIAPITTTASGLWHQTTWWPLLLFSRHMRGHTLAVHVQAGEYDGPTKPDWIRGTIETPWLDVSAAVDADAVVSLVVVNVHDQRAFATRLHGVCPSRGTQVDVYTVTGPSVDSRNTEDTQEVAIRESKWDAEGLYEFPKASMTMFRWKP